MVSFVNISHLYVQNLTITAIIMSELNEKDPWKLWFQSFHSEGVAACCYRHTTRKKISSTFARFSTKLTLQSTVSKRYLDDYKGSNNTHDEPPAKRNVCFVKITLSKNNFQKICDIIFICKNGTLSCHSQIISVFSDFFQDKIRACENMGNKLDFDYKDYEKKVIKSYLDRLYSIETWIKPLNHAEKLKLLQRARFRYQF